MFFALLLAPSIILMNNGVFEATVDVVREFDATRLDWFGGGTLRVVGVISALAWGLGYFGQPHILARFLAADPIQRLPAARRIGLTWMILCLAGSLGVGFLGIPHSATPPAPAGPVDETPQ